LQTFVGEKGSIKEEVESLKQRFDVYEKGLRKTPPYEDLIQNRSLKRMFIAEGISDEFLKEVQKRPYLHHIWNAILLLNCSFKAGNSE
jgi:hypothetical protein